MLDLQSSMAQPCVFFPYVVHLPRGSWPFLAWLVRGWLTWGYWSLSVLDLVA